MQKNSTLWKLGENNANKRQHNQISYFDRQALKKPQMPQNNQTTPELHSSSVADLVKRIVTSWTLIQRICLDCKLSMHLTPPWKQLVCIYKKIKTYLSQCVNFFSKVFWICLNLRKYFIVLSSLFVWSVI